MKIAIQSSVGSLAILLAAMTPTYAQGSDDCDSAMVISGLGQFAFDTIDTTTDGPASCNAMSDVWFAWTAPATGQFEVTTCGLTTMDSVLGIYEGRTCPPTTELGCNDDECGSQSSVLFDALAGQDVLIRVGGFNTWQGTGFFEIRQVPNGGANDCAQATPIQDTGYFAWNTAGTTTDGPSNCAPVFRDLWFAWTAPSTDVYRFTMCGKTTLDTVLAVYDGTSCPPGASLACDDNACGEQSEVTLAVVAGNAYLIQIGAAIDGEVGSGELGIFSDACSAFSNDDALEENDSCASAVTVQPGQHADLWCSKSDPDWYTVNVAAFSSFSFDASFTHAEGDLDLALYANDCSQLLATSTSVDDDELLTWFNPSATAVDFNLQVYLHNESTSDCNNYDLFYVGPGGGFGSKYCTANANSTGSPADIDATGSASASAGDLVLSASAVPNRFGVFFHGADQAQVPFGNGFLCTVNDLVRGVTIQGQGNLVTYGYDNTSSRRSMLDFVAKRRNFQYWFRDPQGGGAFYNTSNAISILITP